MSRNFAVTHDNFDNYYYILFISGLIGFAVVTDSIDAV